MPWVVDGVSEGETIALEAVGGIASVDIEIATMLMGLPWFLDDIGVFEWTVLLDLNSIASKDIDFARLVTELPWITDEITHDEMSSIRSLYIISSNDLALAKQITGLPWFVDEVTEYEHEVLHPLWSDPVLAKTVTSLPWFSDGVTIDELNIIRNIVGIASLDRETAGMITSLPWFSDSVTSTEVDLIYPLDRITRKSTAFAKLRVGHPWFADDVTTNDERRALYDIWRIGTIDTELVPQIAAYVNNHTGDLRSYILDSLAVPLGSSVTGSLLAKLTEQPWFVDGLDDEEAALLVVLGYTAIHNQTLYEDLLQSHFTQNRTISLPLAGDVNIWIIQNDPFPPDEDLLTIIEGTARTAEGFLGLPFPTTDIILLIHDGRSRYFGSLMALTRYSDGFVGSIPHETAHYYFSAGPTWLVEGGAEFIETYYENGSAGLARRRLTLSDLSFCSHELGIENIRHLRYLGQSLPFLETTRFCGYPMGEHFLLSIFDTVGGDAMSNGLREALMYLWNKEFRRGLGPSAD